MDETTQSASGQPIYHHRESAPLEAAVGDPGVIASVERHVEQHFGPIDSVFHEAISVYVHVDLHIVMPTDERPVITVVTSGMSARPMADGTYAELMLALPPTWPTGDNPAFRTREGHWPFGLLQDLARLPHEFETALGVGHTIPNGPKADRYARNTKLCCALIAPMVLAPERADTFTHDGHEVQLLSVWPLHRDEMELKLQQGLEALIEPFDEAGVSEILDIDRPSALPRRRRRFFGR